MGGDTGSQGLCRRCMANAAQILVRQDQLCNDCFVRYVNTKIIKRMEHFRVRNVKEDKPRRLVLPLSLGPSSTTLLHALTSHIDGQIRKTGRAGYTLRVVHVVSSQTDKVGEILAGHKARYPLHEFEVIQTAPPARRRDGEGVVAEDEHGLSLQRSVVSHAVRNSCQGVLWSDTTTTLAERVLASAAKGRGESLPFLLRDEASDALTGTAFYFPMRDLLRKELWPFIQLEGLEPLVDGENQEAQSSDRTTIDGLMKGYFETVEKDYPSTIANVVRTASRLRPPAGSEGWAKCEICRMPFQGDGEGSQTSELCYGCRQTVIS